MASGTEIGTGYISIVPSARGFAGKLQSEIGGQAGQVGQRVGADVGDGMGKGAKPGIAAFAGLMKGALVGAAIGVGIAAGKGIADGIRNASDLNETLNKSAVIFGNNSKAMEDWASGAAKNLGLSKQKALEAAAGFGDMFSQLGFSGDQAAKMSRDVVQLSTDLGSFNNLPTAEVADMISAAFRGEYDSLQRLVPNINAARVEQEALAMTGKKSAKELTAQEKAAATLAIVQRDGARANGDFAKTSDGLANQQKILAAQWDDLSAKMGQAFLPILTKVLGFVTGTAIPAIESFFGGLKSGGEALGPVGEALSGFATSAGAILGPAIAGLGEKFSQLGAMVGPIVQQIFGAIADKLVAWGPQISAAMSQVVEIIGGAMTLIGVIVGAATAALSWLWDTCGQTIINTVTSLFANLGTIFGGALDVIQGIVNFFIALFTGNWQGMADAIVQIGSGLWQMVVGIFTLGKDLVLGQLNLLSNLALGIFTFLRDGAVNLATMLMQWVVDRFIQLRDGAIAAVTWLRDVVLGTFGNLRDGSVNTAQNIRDWVLQRFDSLRDGAVGAMNWMRDRIGEAFGALRRLAADPVRFIIDVVLNNGIIKAFNTVSDFLKGPHLNPVPLPAFAKGDRLPGYAPSDTADNMLYWGTPGEFLTRRASVRSMDRLHPGVLEYINEHGRLPGFAAGGYTWPVPGYRASRGAHGVDSGVDIASPMGTPVVAARDSTVTRTAMLNYSYGHHIRTSDGAIYAHLSRILVSPGQQVKAGQVIGLVGSTGNSTGPHLHFVSGGGIAGAIGNIISGAGTMVQNMFGGFATAAEWLKNLAGGALKRLGEAGSGPFAEMVKKVPGMLMDTMVKKVTDLGSQFMASAANLGGVPTGALGDRVKSIVAAAAAAGFQVSSVGGYRPEDGYGEHSTGRAFDLMVPNKASGDFIADYVLKNFGTLGVKHIIWWQRINSGTGWRQMADRGSPTQNHMDHPHIFFRAMGGRIPEGYWQGTNSATPGWHQINEHGLEWINTRQGDWVQFRGGEKVLPHGQEPPSAGSINFNGPVGADPYEVVRMIRNYQRTEAILNGIHV